VKTTLEIPDTVFRQIKARAAMEGIKLKDIVADALDLYLRTPRVAPKALVNQCPFPIVRGKGGPLLKKLNAEAIAAIEEEEDLQSYGRSLRR
jgi:hypothetical protein